MSIWKHIVCLLLVILFPLSIMAQDQAGAVLHANGSGVFRNQSPAPASIALFPNDLVETKKDAAARIDLSGSSADINPETTIQFESDEIVLDHGSLSVNTSHGLRVRVGCITITPVKPTDWTHYDVTDLDGKVTVSSHKSDVYLDAHSRNLQQAKQTNKTDRSIVHETEQKSRDEKCGAAAAQEIRAAVSPAGVLSSPWAIAGGAATVGVLACWALCRSDNPISPDKPKP